MEKQLHWDSNMLIAALWLRRQTEAGLARGRPHRLDALRTAAGMPVILHICTCR